jgi:hypothetical protein
MWNLQTLRQRTPSENVGLFQLDREINYWVVLRSRVTMDNHNILYISKY